ncbi:histone-lysine N-methyltransferase SETMAR-like [Solenopsis invicta]|uniref:histone-lysine N-methyltransferase SETMAR-like n=1 Tax=Solenopsis invicta TaxID=13686 RepID=UPI00193CAB33|nr:histone-lysine N-methyltransferase SETMAR-like [Solenopsis invicta]
MNHARAAQDMLVQCLAEAGGGLAIVADPYRIPEDNPNWVGDSSGKVAMVSQHVDGAPPMLPVSAGEGFVMVEYGPIDVLGCYFPTSMSRGEFEAALDGMESDILSRSPRPVVVGGDLNAYAVDWGCPRTDTRGRLARDFAAGLGLQLRAIFLYEFKLGHKAAEAIRNINSAFGQGSTNELIMRRWFQKFRNGDESLEDEKDRGRPSAVGNDKLKVLLEADPRTTIRQLAVKLNASHPTILDHLRQLRKSKKLDKWVPHELNKNKKNRRYEVCSMLLLRNNNNPFLDRIVTCDENESILYDNQRRSTQWLDRGEAPQHFPKPKLH